MGGLRAKSMTSQRYRAVTRWRICVTMATLWQQQDSGYALLFYIFNSTVIDWTFLWYEEYRVLVGKPEEKRPLGRPRRRWENNIKIDLQEVGGGCGDWMELAQDRKRWRALVSTVMNFRVPKMRGISWLAAKPVRFSRRTLLHGVSK